MSPALLAVGVAIAGSLGAIARYALDTGLSAWLADRARARSGGRGRTSDLPWATLLVNVSGSLLLGAVAGLSARHGLPHDALAIVGVGFCGGYTTFSAASVGAVTLVRDRRYLAAAGYALGTLALSVAAAALGVWAVSR